MTRSKAAPPETREVVSPQGHYSLVLPGTWAAIPLGTETAMRKRIVALVKRQVGTGDRLVRVRRATGDELLRTAQKARANGAQSFLMSLEILPGIPFPAALISSDRAWPGGARAADADLAAALAVDFPGAEQLRHRMGPVARSSEIGLEKVGETQTVSLLLEYWVPYPDGRGLLNFTISAPMASDPELYTLLFDALIDSLTWTGVRA